jgi:hypothetical protein
MSQISRLLQLVVLGFSLIGIAGSAYSDYSRTGEDFSLEVEHSETRWMYASETLTSKSTILGIRLDQTLAPRLRGTLLAGFIDLSQPANPLPAARVTDGYYGGIDLVLLLLDLRRLRLELGGGYHYHNTQGSYQDINTDIIWHDTYAQLGLRLSLSERLDLHATGGALQTSGEQRISGSLSQLLTFEEEQQEYYSAGLSYWLDGTGYIKATWLGGGREGFRFSFHRQF